VAVIPDIRLVSPAHAKALLARNDDNRTVRSRHVRQLAEAMRADHWVFNGETIKIASDGTLLDGQHRLMAVIEAGATLPMTVVEGLPRPVQNSIDTGRKRRLPEVLHIRGYADVYWLATSVNALYRFRATGAFGRGGAPTTPQALELLEREPQIVHSLRVAKNVYHDVHGSVAIFAASHRVFSDHDSEKAEEFFTKLRHGTNLGERNPILLLRRQMIRASMRPKYTPVPQMVAGLTFKAFVAWRDGRRMQQLGFRPAVERLPSLEPTEATVRQAA
jgi:hypothetical protein